MVDAKNAAELSSTDMFKKARIVAKLYEWMNEWMNECLYYVLYETRLTKFTILQSADVRQSHFRLQLTKFLSVTVL